jgi:TonB family protein
MPKDPAEILEAAAQLYNFSSPTLKPWHMKVSYQLYDEESKPTVRGSYEYWWAAPDTYRSSWARPDSSGQPTGHTDWHVNGKHFRAGTGPSLSFFERKLQSDLLTPLPRPEDLDMDKVRLEKQEQKFGNTKAPCVMLIRKMPLLGRPQVVPLGEFPTFCFDPAHPVLIAYYAFGSTTVGYNKVSRVQGMMLARDLSVYEGKRKVLTATVDSVSGLAAAAPELTPSAEAVPERTPEKVEISSGLATGYLVKQVRPQYPQEDKDNRVSGKVVLRALIGRDGHVHDLSVVEGPSPTLIGAAMVAVSQWEYKPYILNGEPIDVTTTVNVIFHLGN